jgi:DNA-binding HxlR family transcriptional regulator
VRAGAHALSLLSAPLNVQVLQALEEEPKSLIDLRRAAGSPPQTTMRAHLRALGGIGVLERRRRAGFPASIDHELTASGRELLAVADVLRSWLRAVPDGGPLELGSTGAKSAIKALVEGWSSTIVRALAARPLSLTELDKLIAGVNYPSLERRLGAMRLAGQIEACPGPSRGTPYAVTKWMRHAIVPLIAAARWERRNAAASSTPIGRIDIEAAFLLTVPRMRLPADVAGACRLAIEVRGSNGDSGLAGVMVQVEQGRVVSCVSRLQGEADAWALGTAQAWIQAVIEDETDAIETGGDCELATALLDALYGASFRVRQCA